MLKLLLPLIFVALVCSKSVIAHEDEDEKNDNDDDSFVFQCPENRIMSLHNRSVNSVVANCYIPYVCGQVHFCAPSAGPVCPMKFQYMSGVQVFRQGVQLICCALEPKPDGDESCYDITVLDKNFPLRKGPPPKPRSSAGSHQAQHQHGHPKGRPAAPRTRGRQGRSVQAPGTFTVKADIKPCAIAGGHPANEYIKGIQKMPNGYKVTVCTPMCRSSTSTVTRTPTTRRQTATVRPTTPVQTQPPQQPPRQPETPHKKTLFPNGHGCFSSDMTVVTANGLKRMDQLQVGDKVQVFTSESEQQFQAINWFYHRDADLSMNYLDLTTATGRQLSITPNHLIPIIDCTLKTIEAPEMDQLVITSSKFASRARIGMCLATSISGNSTFQPDRIIRIEGKRKSGVFSPITDHGTIVVNGVQTSCFSSVENHLLQRTIHSVLVRASQIVQYLRSLVWSPDEKVVRDIPASVKFLLEVAKQIIPEYIFT